MYPIPYLQLQPCVPEKTKKKLAFKIYSTHVVGGVIKVFPFLAKRKRKNQAVSSLSGAHKLLGLCLSNGGEWEGKMVAYPHTHTHTHTLGYRRHDHTHTHASPRNLEPARTRNRRGHWRW
ncbi:hypothetical protein HBI49_017870 [Parastagonospora nodorum]|nr:hypothetical protein HBH95_045500 [Parastagonospora nodorum]KAH5111384.1 hypothetical protein HBH72_016910 [Parastagonospora nodorum]KAH5319502.1 hypothetical protein HBI12_114630 [Parastagonospora nodorum]KAH5379426.1 hypothetical protein HBI49_017870 [Parastagonospora nodorum]KAH5532388.1 hypothetical protein HBI52_005570 [Parastagonospora nodorum]